MEDAEVVVGQVGAMGESGITFGLVAGLGLSVGAGAVIRVGFRFGFGFGFGVWGLS